jgi:hypothetical protein
MENNEQNIQQEQPDCSDSRQGSSRAKVLKTAIFVVVLLAVGALATHSFIAGDSPCSILRGAKSLSTPCPSTITNPEIPACPLKQSTCTKEKTCAKKPTCPLADKAACSAPDNPENTPTVSCPKTSAEK